jgi:hypothetical protein
VANARYQARYRETARRGRSMPGALMPATEVRLRIRQLQAERFSKAEIARRSGLKRLRPLRDQITPQLARKILTFFTLVNLEGPDVPESEAAAVRRGIPDRSQRDAGGDPRRI